MKWWQYWALWFIPFIVGNWLVGLYDCPTWGKIIGGWVLAFGIMGKQPNA